MFFFGFVTGIIDMHVLCDFDFNRQWWFEETDKEGYYSGEMKAYFIHWSVQKVVYPFWLLNIHIYFGW